MLDRLREWLRERKEKLDLFDETNVDRLHNPLYALGHITYFSWIVVFVTGVLLMIWYEPTVHGAYNSVMRIQYEVPLGWLIRGAHKHGSNMLILAITLRLYRMYFLGEYKRPNELTWMILFLALVLVMISGLTGYLLIWNQRAFWAAKTVLSVSVFLDQIPIIGATQFGSAIAFIFLGGPAVGEGTLTRFYVIHVGISMLALIAVELYYIFTRRRRFALSPTAIVVLLVMLVVAAYVFPPELGRRADADRTPMPILSDWYFLALYQYVKYTPPLWAGIGPGLLVAFSLLVPFLDRSKGRRPSERPFFTVVGVMAIAYFLVFTTLMMFNIAVMDREPHIVLVVTTVVLALGLVLELRYRRRRRLAEGTSPRPEARAVAARPAATGG